MFLKRMHDLSGTLAFRIAAWYAVVFTICSIFTLFFFYYKVSVITLERLDNALIEEIDDFAIIMSGGDLDIVERYMTAEVESKEYIFFRLVSLEQGLLAMKNKSFWNQDYFPAHIPERVKRTGKPVLYTIDLPGYKYPVRIISGMISPNVMLQAGISLAGNKEYTGILKRLLLNLILPLFAVSTVVGWFMGRRALKGVEEVTLTAMEITKGDYDRRVRVKKRLMEVSRLADTFNTMLDRIQVLLKSTGEITDNVAHDLRSPLARIRGIAEMTLIGKSSISDYEKMAASTIEECDTLINLINTMLDITEIEAGLGRTEKAPLDLKIILDEACELFQPVADEKEIIILSRLPDEIFILGDKSKLQRMVTNLLENAIKYTGQGGTVTVSMHKDNHRVCIEFADTGIGIAGDDLPRIFQRFYRCDNSRSQSGTGLGLCLVKAVVNTHGGDIRVESTLGCGSTFTVSLPL